jgi:hypothetical protein
MSESRQISPQPVVLCCFCFLGNNSTGLSTKETSCPRTDLISSLQRRSGARDKIRMADRRNPLLFNSIHFTMNWHVFCTYVPFAFFFIFPSGCQTRIQHESQRALRGVPQDKSLLESGTFILAVQGHSITSRNWSVGVSELATIYCTLSSPSIPLRIY